MKHIFCVYLHSSAANHLFDFGFNLPHRMMPASESRQTIQMNCHVALLFRVCRASDQR